MKKVGKWDLANDRCALKLRLRGWSTAASVAVCPSCICSWSFPWAWGHMVSPLGAFYGEESWRVRQCQLVSTTSAFTAMFEETWIYSCTPTNQTQPRATATRESISPLKILSTVNIVQRLLWGMYSVKQFVQLWFSQEEACLRLLLCWWSRSC